MRTALLLLLALAAPVLSSTASAADVWKWVDEKGITHYSDQPVPGASKMEVRAGNIAETPAPAAESSEPDAAAAAPVNYRIEIVQPENGQSVINTGGQVNVVISVSPSIQTLHAVGLYLDGKLVTGFPRNTLSYALTDVPRGTHNVSAMILDQRGKTLLESSPVEFTVRQESVAKPPVGPSLKPPPKPRPRTNAKNTMPTSQPTYGALNGGRAAVNPATNLPVVTKPAPKPKKP